MRVARFSVDGADPRFGIVDDEDLVVLRADPIFAGYDTTGERVPLAEARLLAPVIPRSKVVCVGMNYAAHAATMGYDERTDPLIFLKPNTAVVGPGDPIRIPPVEGRITHEGELAIVIGRVGKQVKAADWRSIVFGYTIANDVSARDEMFKDGQWARAKGFDSFCPLGPWIETDLDVDALEIRTYVSGEPRREGNTRDMVHKLPELIEYISDVWTLLPGDVIITGTPDGLGGFHAGDTVDIDIEGIGRLSNPAVDRDA
ncbi:MAG: fumarylacetoacetate hydrolase family protein [Micrococcales bacterium]|nr:fumarylacetoacetate hydrolase family protein [Micrococcales bacterium]